MGIVNDIIGEQHDEEIKRLKEERDYYKTALKDIADRWEDDTAHSRQHAPDCDAVVCLAKRALYAFDGVYIDDKFGTKKITLDEFCVTLNDNFMVDEFKDNMKNIKDKLKTGRMWFNYWNVFMIYNQKKVLLSDDHRDCDGNPITLEKLCRDEPEWAANIIRTLKNKLSNAM